MEIVGVEKTPSDAISLALTQVDLHTLALDLNEDLEKEKDALEERLFNLIDGFQEHMENVTERMASNLQCNFSSRMEESVQIITKIFSLSASDIELIKDQIENKSNVVHDEVETISTLSTPPTVTTMKAESLPRDCTEALELELPTGITTIRPTTEEYPKRVWCDQETDGGGWTIMLRRQPQPIQVDFSQNWDEYVQGFGDPEGEYWIGLETLYQVTKKNQYKLRIELQVDGEKAYSNYGTFRVGPDRRDYKLRVEDYNVSSTGGDALSYHSGRRFTTKDNDNDSAPGENCANISGGGGWWYGYCYLANPTGLHSPANYNGEADMYLEWRKWRGYHAYPSHFTMMIKAKT